ncbi:RNA polymerase sigma factor [Candidatus Hydrogenedentota bacterium]
MANKTSDRSAWVRHALERYEGALIRYAMSITRDPEQARDVVQDTFLRMCKADRKEIEAKLAQWLFTVCRNRAFDIRKKEGRMEPLGEREMETHASPRPGPRAVASSNEAHRLVLDTVATLPDNQREVFRLKFNDEMTYSEICELTGLTYSNVRYIVHTSLKTLREKLRGHIDLAREI